jgi:hypothetical protein
MPLKLHIAIIEAKGLKGMGLMNRPQDPYCVLTLVGHGEPQQARSEVALKTNTPRWESPAFIFTLLNLSGMPLELSIWNDSTNTLRSPPAQPQQRHAPLPPHCARFSIMIQPILCLICDAHSTYSAAQAPPSR